jgi:hypothetical protein
MEKILVGEALLICRRRANMEKNIHAHLTI